MSKAAELIEGLATDAEFVSDGSFSLDREKARQKMRQFQLADPHRYVLLLVEAATLRGATQIRFEIDSDDMRMDFDAALTEEDLDELYTALFVDRSHVEIRSRRELALACNAVMALNPRFCRIESVRPVEREEGEGGAAFAGVCGLLQPEADDQIEALEPGSVSAPAGMKPPWTRIHVKDRFRPGLLVRFVHDMRGTIPEEQLIRARCRYSPLSISLDGTPVSSGLPQDLLASERFEGEDLRGVAGIATDPDRSDRSAIVLISNGVQVITHELGESIDGLWFYVDCSRFRKDVSQGDIVRNDPVYEAMLEQLAPARDRVLERLVEQWTAGDFNAPGSRLSSNEVFDLLRGCFMRWANADWLRPDAGPLGRLADMPFWRTIDDKWLSPRALAEQVDKLRGFMYSDRNFDGVAHVDWGPVVYVIDGESEAKAMQRIYPGARSVSEKLARQVPWELKRRKWRATPHAIELPRGDTRYEMSYEQGEHRGCVALRPGHLSSVRVVVEGCLLTELELELGFIGLAAVITGPLQPMSDYERPRFDRAYATALILLLAQIPKLIQAWARDEVAGDVVKRCLLSITKPNYAVQWLQHFGFPDKPAGELVARIGIPDLMPELSLAHGQPDNALTRVIDFTTVDSRRVTLADIEHERRSRPRHPGKILFVDRSATPTTGVAELILHTEPDERRLLVAVFGAEALHDDTAAYLRELGRRNFEAKPQRSPSMLTTTWVTKVALEATAHHGRIQGFVGIGAVSVRRWEPSESRRVMVEVLTEGRYLCTVEERCWLPGVEASLAWENAPANDDWDGIAGPTWPLRAAVDAGLIELIGARAEAGKSRRPNADERRMLWLGMVAPFISAAMFRAWQALRRHHADNFEAAVEAYVEVMELFPGVPRGELEMAINLALEASKAPTRAEIMELLDRGVVPPSGGRDFHRGILRIYPMLESIPMIEQSSGEAISLATLARSFEEVGEIAYIEDRSVSWNGADRLIIRADDVDQVQLIRLFGADVFTEASAWIHERRHQQRFESRAQLEDIRVPDHNRLVGVEFSRDEFEGEVAIPAWTCGEGGEMALTFCHDRRVIQELELHSALPIIGIVDDPKAELSADYSRVETANARMAALRKLLGVLLNEELLPRLAEVYPSLDSSEQSIARSWIYNHWRRHSPRAGDYRNRLSEAGKRFASLKLFADVDGEARCLDELIVRNKELGALWYVERHPGHSVAPPFAIVEARGPELAILEALFPKLADFSLRWDDRVAGARRKQRAPDMPEPKAPKDAISVVEIKRHGMHGEIWLPSRTPFEPGVILGSQGKVVDVENFVDRLPVQGAIAGLEADDGFESVEFSGPQRRYLVARTIFAYSNLLNAHRRDVLRPERADFMELENVEKRRMRFALLREAAIALARARLAGERFDAILGNAERRLIAEPLLQIASGRLISVQVAAKARPQELAHLEIWDPDTPALSPDLRARLLLGEGEPTSDDDDDDDAQAEDSSEREAEASAEPEVEMDDPIEPPMALEALGMKEADTDELIDLAALSLQEISAISDEFTAATELLVFEPEPEPDHVGVLLERVRAELRLLREHHQIQLPEGLLDCIHAEDGRGEELVSIAERVIFDSRHPRFVRALEDPDPIWVSFLASVAYTALNHWLEEVTDADEILFHAGHAELLLTGLLDAGPTS